MSGSLLTLVLAFGVGFFGIALVAVLVLSTVEAEDRTRILAFLRHPIRGSFAAGDQVDDEDDERLEP